MTIRFDVAGISVYKNIFTGKIYTGVFFTGNICTGVFLLNRFYKSIFAGIFFQKYTYRIIFTVNLMNNSNLQINYNLQINELMNLLNCASNIEHSTSKQFSKIKDLRFHEYSSLSTFYVFLCAMFSVFSNSVSLPLNVITWKTFCGQEQLISLQTLQALTNVWKVYSSDR